MGFVVDVGDVAEGKRARRRTKSLPALTPLNVERHLVSL